MIFISRNCIYCNFAIFYNLVLLKINRQGYEYIDSLLMTFYYDNCNVVVKHKFMHNKIKMLRKLQLHLYILYQKDCINTTEY